MDTAKIDKVIADLDAAVTASPENVGVAMGDDLFLECRRRGLLVTREFSVLGLGFLSTELPTFNGKLFAFLHPDFEPWAFKIGEPTN